mmetsp:Transcript_10820/g.18947  ORF Transcript_10820/g.18947 Transcript_10820/m.18947 type:complete len:245 (-) Transcript_10820:58-792(-)
MLHRCLIFAVFLHLAISRSITHAFLGPLCQHIPEVRTNKIHSSESSSRTSLLRGTYGLYDGSDEDLFIALANDKKMAREAEAVTDYPESATLKSGIDTNPEEVVPLIMNALKNNDTPCKNAGLMLVWEFTTDTTKFIFNNNITDFIESCHETAEEFPTSFYGAAMYGQSWDLETEINRVGGKDGWIATQVMKTISSDGRLRRWQWELRKNKRPPDLDCWRVESIGSSDRNGDFEARDRGDGWSD